MNYWLLKTEPASFSIEHLARAPGRRTTWDGVRNYQARNLLRDALKRGDEAFLYHSSCEVPGIVGIVRVVREGYPDPTAFDPRDHHFDPASDPRAPRWYMVDVKFVRRFARVVTLEELRQHSGGALRDLQLLKRGNRLSVLPVSAKSWKFILSLL
jgi:predicted RNA-binding protein with PUA-like domain